MAQRQLSRTLPKNFTFPSLSADEPKTPERPSASIDVPPPPRHSFSSCREPRVRVRSGTDVCARMDLDLFRSQGMSEVPLPSIEVPQQQSAALETPFSDEWVNDERYLAPPRQRMAFETPPAQIRGTPLEACDTPNSWVSWEQTPLANSITRPDSACSNHSDSSIGSIETFASRPSVGGSCTSAESDGFDPYFPLEISKEVDMESPTRPKKHQVLRAHSKDNSWTREMDNHLWNTYQLYLQDPTMTPFKMTPGSIPPLGVTARVSRRARKTWEKRRHRITDSLAPQTANRSGSSTPKAMDGAAGPVWPKSDTKTRRRLKLLCRRKFCIMPHYQRMMQSRSPEPVADMLGVTSESRARGFADNNTAYGTRDLGVSLVSNYVPTPLTRLAEPAMPAEPQADWFNNPVQITPAEPMAQPQTQHLSVEATHNIPRLGSPFVYSTWGPGGSNRQVQDLPASARTMHAPSRRLRRNNHLQRTSRYTDNVFGNAYENKDPSDEEVQRRLEHYIRDNKFQSVGHGRVRIRNRGATTTGAVAPRDVDQLFSPPSSLNSSHAEESSPFAKPPVNPLLNLHGENIKRLGSPFKLEGGVKRREAPGRSARHAPSLSDPFLSGGLPSYPGPPTNPYSIQEQEQATRPLLQDPFEEGLSDAERIRRQLVNRSFMRN